MQKGSEFEKVESTILRFLPFITENCFTQIRSDRTIGSIWVVCLISEKYAYYFEGIRCIFKVPGNTFDVLKVFNDTS